MCGIVGFQGDFTSELLRSMVAAVAHRGPDGEGSVEFRAEGGSLTGLGHRRLAIIDLSDAACQPMRLETGGHDETSGLTLVYNGEIYNYRELQSGLRAQGHRFRTASDSEVLLHMYERHGLAMLDKLNGIFAFAIHDNRREGRPEGVARGALFLARDHMGVKPLYFAEEGDGFLFASELKALLCHAGLSRAIDPVALQQTLGMLWTPAPRTVLAAVRKVPPGTALIVHEGKIRRRWSYYVMPYRGIVDKRRPDDIALELADLVATAVKRQLVSDVPVGAFLSGGLDSSAIVAMMRRARAQERITCFTIAYPDELQSGDNEPDLPYARRAAAHLGVELEEVTMSPSAISRLPEMVRLLDEPQGDPAPINALLIAERARAMGIPVLLSGAGGDDLFGGYRRHWALNFERRWSWLPRAIRLGIQSGAAAAAGGKTGGQGRPALRRLAKMFAHAGESPERRLVSYFLWSTDGVRQALYSPAFAEAVGNADVCEPLLESLQLIPRETDPLQRMLFLEARHFLADHNLNYTDRAGMAVGVEIRVPLLDVDLANFATRTPASLKQQGRVGKAIFKRAMEPYLPRDIIYRPKSGFGVPLRRWLRDELRPMVDETLDPTSIRRRGFFEPAAVRKLIDMDRSGALDGSYTLYTLMCIELWCRQFLDTPIQ
ncbi:MAG: asparagine synthase (glutamine-hydrolyzing) [Pseudomonadota bacterium]